MAPKATSPSNPRGTVKAAFFGKKVSVDTVKCRILRGEHCGFSQWVLSLMTRVLLRERRRETGNGPREVTEDGGRTWRVLKLPEAEEARTDSPSRALEGVWPGDPPFQCWLPEP